MGYGWQLSARNQDGIVYLTYSQSAKKACHCEPVRRLAWQSVTNNVKFPIYYADLRHLDYGFPRRFALLCCGSQNFHAAFRRALEILTAATRSPRCICHRQRSVRSLGMTGMGFSTSSLCSAAQTQVYHINIAQTKES